MGVHQRKYYAKKKKDSRWLANERERQRNKSRRARSVAYLIDIEYEALLRNISTRELVKRLMVKIVEDDLYKAILGE